MFIAVMSIGFMVCPRPPLVCEVTEMNLELDDRKIESSNRPPLVCEVTEMSLELDDRKIESSNRPPLVCEVT